MNRRTKKSSCGMLLAAGAFFLCGFALAETAEQSPVRYTGSVRATYDYRGLGEYEDHDVYGYWYLRASDLADKQMEIYTSGRLYGDLDGSGSSYADDPFISLDDTSDNESARILQLYVDIHDPKKINSIRAGRQYVDIADYIQMDGIQVMLQENKALGGRVFAGLPTSYYSSVSGDMFAGASLVGRPWDGNRSRVTYARYEDESEQASDNHYFLDVRQQFMDEVRGRTYLSVMNEDVRMGGADIMYISLSETPFDAAVGVRRWGEYDAETRAYSPLVEVLGDQEPYTTGYGRFTAPLIPSFYISPGVMVRYPDDTDETNKGYERYDIGLIYEPSKSFESSLALEYWDVEEGERFFGLSGDIRYRYRKLWELSLGAAYADYTYFEFSDFSLTADGGGTTLGPDGTRIEASPYAYTYFLRGKWNITEHMAVRVSGEIEDDSEEDDLAYRLRTSFEVRL